MVGGDSMAIRPIDMQTIIPKTPEIQKIKSAEPQNQYNNQLINMQKDQQQTQKTLKQVNETKKAEKGRVERDNKNSDKKNKNNNKKKDEESSENTEKKQSGTRIDIRI